MQVVILLVVLRRCLDMHEESSEAKHVKEAAEVVPSVPSGDSLARQFKRVKSPSLGTDSTTSSAEKAVSDESLQTRNSG